MKANWKEQNLELKDLKEIDIDVLGKFVQGLTMDDLNGLSEDVQLIAIKKLGEFTGLPEDKLKSRANMAYQYLQVRSVKQLNKNKHIKMKFKISF